MSNETNLVLKKFVDNLENRYQNAKSWLLTEGSFFLNSTSPSLLSIVGQDVTMSIITGLISPLMEISKQVTAKREIPDLITRIQEKLPNFNMEFFESTAGRNLLKQTIFEIVNSDSEDNMEYYKRFLVNANQKPDSENFYTKIFSKIIFSFEPIHFHALTSLNEGNKISQEIITFVRNNPNEKGRYRLQLINQANVFFGLEPEIFKEILIFLRGHGLIEFGFNHGWDGDLDWIESEKAYDLVYEQITKCVTPKGKKFIEYLTD